jgi:addiction module HigA family antidote
MVGKSQRHAAVELAHPGELLGEVVIPATGKTNVEIAALLGVSRQTLYEVVDQKRSITPAMAVRLGKLFGNGPELWLNMQQAYDLWHAQRDSQAAVAKMPPLRDGVLRPRAPAPASVGRPMSS